MIEVVSYPPDLSQWNPTETPFYLELFGETSPQLDTQYAAVIPTGAGDGTVQTMQPSPMYEYWWTIGHGGHRHHEDHWHLPFLGGGQSADLWEELPGGSDEIVARVYIFFPRIGGWRIKELTATVKYLSPFGQEHTPLDRLAEHWKHVQPLISDASSLATAAAGLAGGPAGAVAGAAAGRIVNTLSALAQLQINSVPQTAGFQWSVAKVTFGSEQGVMQGVMWELPKNMFRELGGRLTGSIAVSFIPAPIQVSDHVDTSQPYAPKKLPILAHAVVYKLQNGNDVWAPRMDDLGKFVKLYVEPQLTGNSEK